MCGRFALFALPELLAEYFALAESVELAPRYNLTPGQDIAAVRLDRSGQRRLHALRWGLIPFWAKDPKIGNRLVNARLEGIAEKPAFREAFARRRCLIAASGFYEWSKIEGSKQRQPYYIRARAEPLLVFAGLWERWRAADSEEPLDTCVIVTTAASDVLQPIHERMPVMLTRAAQDVWLDPSSSAETIAALASQGPEVDAWAVNNAVNDPRNDDERLLEPLQRQG